MGLNKSEHKSKAGYRLLHTNALLSLTVCALCLCQAQATSSELLQRLLYTEPNQHIQELGRISDTAGALQRTFLSPAHRRAASRLEELMQDAGLEVHIDKVANVRGRLRSHNPNKPALLTGSHYDTVKDAGKYDGMLGIIVPIASVKALILKRAVDAGLLSGKQILGKEHIRVPELLTRDQINSLVDRPVEVMAFCDEEGIRFQTTFLGSRAIVGSLLSSGSLSSKDHEGVSVREAISSRGDLIDVAELDALAYHSADVLGYVEVHMEQGPILEAQKLPLGLVKGIAGQARYSVSISGVQGHAGTTPMSMRKDPMPAMAEILNWMEKRCGGGRYSGEQEYKISADDNLMCTTGSIDVWPNAFNVIAGSVNFTLDVRSRNDEVWQSVIKDTGLKIKEVCARRGLKCDMVRKNTVNAVHSDTGLLQAISKAIESSRQVTQQILPGSADNESEQKQTLVDETNAQKATAMSQPEGIPLASYKPPSLVSGAGHDALELSKLTKMAMMFVRCAGGHSHSPLEYVSPSDVAAAASAMLSLLQDQLVSRPLREEL